MIYVIIVALIIVIYVINILIIYLIAIFIIVINVKHNMSIIKLDLNVMILIVNIKDVRYVNLIKHVKNVMIMY